MNATRRDLEKQLDFVIKQGWLPSFQQQAKRTKTTTAFLLGKGSRETNLKNIRGDYRNGKYNGFGVNQVDIGTYPNAPHEWSPANFEPFFVKGTDIYLEKVRQITRGQGKNLSVRGRSFVGKAGLEPDDIRRIATAAYNCGLWGYYHFSKGNNVDSTTTGKDYSRDVYDRAVEFADILEKKGVESDAVPLELELQGKYARREHLKRFSVATASERIKLPAAEPLESEDELNRADYEREPLEDSTAEIDNPQNAFTPDGVKVPESPSTGPAVENPTPDAGSGQAAGSSEPGTSEPPPPPNPTVVEPEIHIGKIEAKTEPEKEVSGIKASAAAVVTFVTTTGASIWALFRDISPFVIGGIAFVGVAFIIARFWFVNQENKRLAAANEAEKIRAHEMQKLIVQGAQDENKTTVRIV